MKLSELLKECGDREITDVKKVLSLLEKKGAWNMEKGDSYYYIASFSGIIDKQTWRGDDYDLAHLGFGNVFMTREEAIKEISRKKIESLLKEYSKGYEFTFGETNYFLAYHCGRAIVTSTDEEMKFGGIIYFESFNDAKQAIEKIGQERLVRGYFQISKEEYEDAKNEWQTQE